MSLYEKCCTPNTKDIINTKYLCSKGLTAAWWLHWQMHSLLWCGSGCLQGVWNRSKRCFFFCFWKLVVVYSHSGTTAFTHCCLLHWTFLFRTLVNLQMDYFAAQMTEGCCREYSELVAAEVPTTEQCHMGTTKCNVLSTVQQVPKSKDVSDTHSSSSMSSALLLNTNQSGIDWRPVEAILLQKQIARTSQKNFTVVASLTSRHH